MFARDPVAQTLNDSSEREAQIAACEALLADPDLPTEARREAERNRIELMGLDVPPAGGRQSAPLLAGLCATRTAEIQLEAAPDWPRYNPSIAADGDGYRAAVRTASYALTEEGWHRFFSEVSPVRTVNYLAKFDQSLTLTGVEPIAGPAAGPGSHETFEGYEDLRLVEVAGGWYALATVRDHDPARIYEMVLLALDGPRIERVAVLPGPTPGRHEKNWMPYAVGERLRIVYSCGPTIVFDCDPATGTFEELSRHEAPRGAGALRGGSQGVAVDGGHLFVVHDVLTARPARRTYRHRFVRIDAEGRLTDVSPRWSFAGERVEMCTGMARRGDELVLSYGVWDRAVHLAVCSLDDVMASLEPADGQLARPMPRG